MHPKVILQYLIPQHLLSRFAGLVAESTIPWLKNALIDWFIKRYQVDMSSAVVVDPHAYLHFNDFFTRRLKSESRPILGNDHTIISPVDATIYQLGHINQGQLIQAKGRYFSLVDLLGANQTMANLFDAGRFVTFYLAPKDYHRVHMPIAGMLRETIYIPGRLFSVNPLTTQAVSQLFARNERLVCLFDTVLGPMAVILVGAMIVASIEVMWRKKSYQAQTLFHEQYHNTIVLPRGAELGCFKLGSTVILLFSNQKQWHWFSSLAAGKRVKMGEALAKIENEEVQKT